MLYPAPGDKEACQETPVHSQKSPGGDSRGDDVERKQSGYEMKSFRVGKWLAIIFASMCVSHAALAVPGWKIIGWNNLGMHCMDDDYSIFSILPPYNTVDAQLIDNSGRLVTVLPTGVSVTYEAVADPDGSINRSSTGKSNFWDYSLILFGAALPSDTGLPGT